MPVDGLAVLPVDLPVLSGGEDIVLESVEILHVFFEAPGDAVQAGLPPALHPTIPGALYATVFRAGDSPWGPFTLAEVRLAARLREKPRAFLLGAAIQGGSADALAAGWGLRAVPAEIDFRRWYDGVEAQVIVDGNVVLQASLVDPEPVPGATLQYGPLANPALVEGVAKVVLVDSVVVFGEDRQRGVPRISGFDGAWWGSPDLQPTLPIGAYYAIADIRLPPPTQTADPAVPAGGGLLSIA